MARKVRATLTEITFKTQVRAQKTIDEDAFWEMFNAAKEEAAKALPKAGREIFVKEQPIAGGCEMTAVEDHGPGRTSIQRHMILYGDEPVQISEVTTLPGDAGSITNHTRKHGNGDITSTTTVQRPNGIAQLVVTEKLES